MNGFGLHEIGDAYWQKTRACSLCSPLSRNAECVVTRVSHTVLTGVWALSMCFFSAYKPYNQLFFIVSRVLHRIIKLESSAFSFIILCITLETIKSRWLSVTYHGFICHKWTLLKNICNHIVIIVMVYWFKFFYFSPHLFFSLFRSLPSSWHFITK